jgi:hypothetical protein
VKVKNWKTNCFPFCVHCIDILFVCILWRIMNEGLSRVAFPASNKKTKRRPWKPFFLLFGYRFLCK